MQVSNRFAFMAKVYKSVEKFDEAIIALIYSLTFHAAETSLLRTNSDDSFHKLLLGMTELTKDVTGHCPDDYVSDSKKRQGLVRDLFSLLHHKNRSEVNSESFGVLDKPNATKMIDVLLKKSYGSSTILSTGLLCSNVLDALVTDEVVSLTPVFNGSSIRNEKIMIATELMMKLGCFLEDHAESEKHQIFASISEYERCHHIIKNFIAQTCDDHTKKQLIMALINIAASFFLISRETTFDFSRLAIEARCAKTKQVPPRYLTISIQFADKAATSMRLNRNLDSVLLVLMTSVSFATDLYQLRLHSFLEKNDVPFAVDVDPRELQNTVAFLGKTKSQSIFTRLTKQILSHVLLRSCNLFSLDGELINSAKMAHLNSLMHSDREISETSWIESIALSSFSTTAVMPSSLSSDFRPETAVSPEQLEVMACRLRLLIHKSNADDEIQNIGNRLRCLMETLQRYQRRPALDNTTACLLQWIKTTIAIALAECDKRVSQLFSAMDLFRHCFAECKVMFSSFSLSAKETSTHTHTQFWRNHQITMLMSRCLTRQIECLERIAVLYTRLGDHRKALQYGKLVVTTAGLNVDTGTNSPMSFSKLIAITRESTCRNCDEIRLRRFFLRLLAAGTPITSLVKEFQNGETALSKVELPSRTCKRSENRMFEELADLGASKSSSISVFCSHFHFF